MQAEVFLAVFARWADVEGPATGKQAAGKTSKPIESMIEAARGRHNALVGQKAEAVLVEKSLIDVEAAINQHAESKSGTGIDDQRADSAGGAFVDRVCIDAANLGDVDEFLFVEGRGLGH